MASKKAESALMVVLIIVGLPIYIVSKMAEGMGGVSTFILIAGVIGCIVTYSNISKKKRKEALLQKYGDAEIVDKIMSRCFWQGQNSEQLLDSLGKPLDIDKKVLKTKSKEIWKYNRTGKNRYGLRITLENDSVIGWDQKD